MFRHQFGQDFVLGLDFLLQELDPLLLLLNLTGGTFYYLCGILDGYSRYIVHWDPRERMTEADIEIILQRAEEE